MEQKFYICKHCGNIIAKVKDAGVPVVCCGEKMSEIIPNTTDAAVEKHLPVWTVENGVVHVKVIRRLILKQLILNLNSSVDSRSIKHWSIGKLRFHL